MTNINIRANQSAAATICGTLMPVCLIHTVVPMNCLFRLIQLGSSLNTDGVPAGLLYFNYGKMFST